MSVEAQHTSQEGPPARSPAPGSAPGPGASARDPRPPTPPASPRPRPRPGADPGLEERLGAELPGVRGLLRRLLGRDAGEAEDLAQEVAARALAYRGSFERGRALGPWLRRAALNVLVDHRARGARIPAGVEATGERADPAAAHDELSAQRDQLEHLLARLSPVEREVLVRFHRDGATVAEVATALDLPIGTVKSHLHRARRRLAPTSTGGLE